MAKLQAERQREYAAQKRARGVCVTCGRRPAPQT